MKSVRIRRFSGQYFPAFGLNTERYFVSLRLKSECEKMRTRKIPYGENFSRSEMFENTEICLGPCQTFMMNIVGKKILRLFGPLKHVYGDYSLKKKDYYKSYTLPLYRNSACFWRGEKKSWRVHFLKNKKNSYLSGPHVLTITIIISLDKWVASCPTKQNKCVQTFFNWLLKHTEYKFWKVHFRGGTLFPPLFTRHNLGMKLSAILEH